MLVDMFFSLRTDVNVKQSLLFTLAGAHNEGILLRGGKSEPRQLPVGRLALGLVTDDLEHLAVRLETRVQELVVEAARRLVILRAVEHEKRVPVAHAVIAPVVRAQGDRADLDVLLGLEAPLLLGDVGRSDAGIADLDAFHAGILHVQGRNGYVLLTAHDLVIREVRELAGVLHLDDEPGVTGLAQSVVIHGDAVVAVRHLRRPDHVLDRLARRAVPSVHVHVERASRPTALVAEINVVLQAVVTASRRLVDVQVEVVEIEPGQRNPEHSAVHLPTGLLHALLDGVSDVASVGPREVVRPSEQLFGFRVARRGERHEVTDVLALEKELHAGRLGQDLRHEVVETDLLRALLVLLAALRRGGVLHEHVTDAALHERFHGSVDPLHVVDGNVADDGETPFERLLETERLNRLHGLLHHPGRDDGGRALVVLGRDLRLEALDGVLDVLTLGEVLDEGTDDGVAEPRHTAGGVRPSEEISLPAALSQKLLLYSPKLHERRLVLLAAVEAARLDERNHGLHRFRRELDEPALEDLHRRAIVATHLIGRDRSEVSRNLTGGEMMPGKSLLRLLVERPCQSCAEACLVRVHAEEVAHARGPYGVSQASGDGAIRFQRLLGRAIPDRTDLAVADGDDDAGAADEVLARPAVVLRLRLEERVRASREGR